MPTPTPMKPDDGAEKYYLVKHGLYYRPNACGYTANVSEAGHFDYKYAMSDVRATAGEKDKNDRVQMIPVPTSPTPDRATELAQWLRQYRSEMAILLKEGAKTQLDLIVAELERLAQVEAAAGEAKKIMRNAGANNHVIGGIEIEHKAWNDLWKLLGCGEFLPLQVETDKCDMLIGPCKCGAWHYSDTAPAAQPTPGKAGA